jgi:hypothetical protein
MGDETNYGSYQYPHSGYIRSDNPSDQNYGDWKNSQDNANKNSVEPAKKTNIQLPVVNFLFFVLSSATNKSIQDFISESFFMVKAFWTPRNADVKKFEVEFSWDKIFKLIYDKNGAFKRIDFPISKAPESVLEVIKNNYSNPGLNPEIPVFLFDAAWDELNDKNPPRGGELRGFTITHTLPWFTGERAILLFSSQAITRTLSHELSHWFGFSHMQYASEPNNIGATGSGVQVDRDQFRKLYMWASDINFRKKLATKLT